MDLSIIILNYKQKGMVKQCVKGILAAHPKLDYEIIVVDNDSNDGCLEAVEELFNQGQENNKSLLAVLEKEKPNIITIQAPKNSGFAYGNNLGLKRARGKYVMVLNPDIAVVGGVLDKMIDFMENNPEAGVIGPNLINPDGTVQYSCRSFPTLLVPLYRRSIFGKMPWAKKPLQDYLMISDNHNKNKEVDWIFGACLLIRKSVLTKIGLFDERFFMYFEDLDLCRRCWEAGFSVYYFAEVELVHYHQRLSAERSGILGIFNSAGRIHLTSGVKYFAKYLGVKLPNRG